MREKACERYITKWQAGKIVQTKVLEEWRQRCLVECLTRAWELLYLYPLWESKLHLDLNDPKLQQLVKTGRKKLIPIYCDAYGAAAVTLDGEAYHGLSGQNYRLNGLPDIIPHEWRRFGVKDKGWFGDNP